MSGRNTGSSSRRPSPRDRGVGRAWVVGGDGAEHVHPHVDRKKNENRDRHTRRHEWPARAHLLLIQHKCNGVRDERGERQAGDRHQALGHAREAEWR